MKLVKLIKLEVAFTLGILTCLGLQWWVMAWMEPDKREIDRIGIVVDSSHKILKELQSRKTESQDWGGWLSITNSYPIFTPIPGIVVTNQLNGCIENISPSVPYVK